MPTGADDRVWLLACVGVIALGGVLWGVGCWLMPLRALRHAWRSR